MKHKSINNCIRGQKGNIFIQEHKNKTVPQPRSTDTTRGSKSQMHQSSQPSRQSTNRRVNGVSNTLSVTIMKCSSGRSTATIGDGSNSNLLKSAVRQAGQTNCYYTLITRKKFVPTYVTINYIFSTLSVR